MQNTHDLKKDNPQTSQHIIDTLLESTKEKMTL